MAQPTVEPIEQFPSLTGRHDRTDALGIQARHGEHSNVLGFQLISQMFKI